MIKYSKEQADFLLNSRKQFNATQAALGVNHLVGNASPLPRYVWEMIDRESVQIQRDVLAVYNDLASLSAWPFQSVNCCTCSLKSVIQALPTCHWMVAVKTKLMRH